MKSTRLLSVVLVPALCLIVTGHQVQAQQPGSGSTNADKRTHNAGTIDLSTLLARTGKTRRRAFSLMPASGDANAGVPAFSITPMTAGNIPVFGNGTLGRLTKWTGFTSSNAAIGDSSIYEDKLGKVGIGTTMPTNRLTVVDATDDFVVSVSQDPSPSGDFGGAAVVAASSNLAGIGVAGLSDAGDGVLGLTFSNFGNSAGIASQGNSLNAAGGIAGRFEGNVRIQKLFEFFGGPNVVQPGDLSVAGKLTVSGTKNFKIDHPLDPENKYLYHAAIESSEVLNVYSGNIALDDKGEALVQLPDWLQAINRDFRYSLTPVGAPMPGLYIAEKIDHNRFKISGGAAGREVSWQVTGVRSDRVMLKYPFKVEEEKAELDRGSYLNPDAYDLPGERSIHLSTHPGMIQQLKERRAQAEEVRKQQTNRR